VLDLVAHAHGFLLWCGVVRGVMQPATPVGVAG
jgi:hypothetical protein